MLNPFQIYNFQKLPYEEAEAYVGKCLSESTIFLIIRVDEFSEDFLGTRYTAVELYKVANDVCRLYVHGCDDFNFSTNIKTDCFTGLVEQIKSFLSRSDYRYINLYALECFIEMTIDPSIEVDWN